MSHGSSPNTFDDTSCSSEYWIKYNLKINKFENMGLVDQGVGCYPLSIEKKRGYLFGIGFTNSYYRFDIFRSYKKLDFPPGL
jgi:hypothetical protein